MRALGFAMHTALTTLVACVAMATSGCEILGGEPAPPSPAYTPCAFNMVLPNCVSGTRCLTSPFQADTRHPAARQCSATCTTAATCPTTITTAADASITVSPACIAGPSGEAQCFVQCSSDRDCFRAVCMAVPGSTSRVCVPDNRVYLSLGERCDPATDFCSGTTCMATNVSSDPSRSPGQATCTVHCTTDHDCDYVDEAGTWAACVVQGGVGVCYPRCGGGFVCPGGTTCTYVASAALTLCLPPA